jgi:GNAT superfamily N-acetyltransferase
MTVVYGDDKLVRGSEVVELYEDAGWSLLAGRPAPEVEESIRQTSVFVTARDGAKLVGFAAALTDRVYYAHVTEIVVRRSHQGRGVSSELLRRVLEALPREKAITIFAEPDAEPFYRQFGFAPTAGGMILRRP